jgi:heterodisulfide reductase subunit B
MLVLACPLCEYNLGSQQDVVAGRHRDFAGLPVVYFTQLLALALGVEPDRCGIASLDSGAQELLKARGVLP